MDSLDSNSIAASERWSLTAWKQWTSGLVRQQWLTPLAPAPLVLMFVVHSGSGLSDAILAASAPGETHWPLYNLAMVHAFQAGIGIYVLHTLQDFVEQASRLFIYPRDLHRRTRLCHGKIAHYRLLASVASPPRGGVN